MVRFWGVVIVVLVKVCIIMDELLFIFLLKYGMIEIKYDFGLFSLVSM